MDGRTNESTIPDTDPKARIRVLLRPRAPDTAPGEPTAFVTVWRNNSGTEITAAREMTLAELERVIRVCQPVEDKDRLPLLKFARFGELRTGKKKALRHDANVLVVSGIEGDHDAGTLSVADAASKLRAVNLCAVIHTTTKHTEGAPRWHVLCPLAVPLIGTPEQLYDQRRGWAGCLNALLGGALTEESFPLSQCFYFGPVRGQPPPQIVRLGGVCIDQLKTPLEPIYPRARARTRNGANGGNGNDGTRDANGNDPNGTRVGNDATDEELRAAFPRGQGRYQAMLTLSSRRAAQGMSVEDIKSFLTALLATSPDPHNADGVDLHIYIAPLAESAVEKFGETRRATTPMQPTPLVRPLPPAAPYPLEALGAVLGPAARAIAEIVQVPAALAANTVLASAALAAQAHANVQTLGGARPLSLYVLTVAESGDRKSAADAVALEPVSAYTRRLVQTHDSEVAQYELAAAARKLARSNARKAHEDAPDEYAAALAEIGNEPEPRKPWVICREPTSEGLMHSLADGQYSQGIFSDEGGQFLGGYALSAESELRTIAMLSQAWQGSPLDRVRATHGEHVTLYGRRLSQHLLLQPMVAVRLLGRELYRGQGFLARWLIGAPESLAGTRQHDPSRPEPEKDPRIRRYTHAIGHLLEKPITEDPQVGGLVLPCLALTPEARALLVAAYNEVERAQAPQGELASVREWASKAAEHVCRIAAVLTLVADPGAILVPGEMVQRAIELMRFYLGEYQRVIGTLAVSPEIQQAQALLEWVQRKQLPTVTARRVMQFGPNAIRSADMAHAALSTLVEHHWLTCTDGKTCVVHPLAFTEDK